MNFSLHLFTSSLLNWLKHWSHENKENDHPSIRRLDIETNSPYYFITNVQRTVGRICIFISGFKGSRDHWLVHPSVTKFSFSSHTILFDGNWPCFPAFEVGTPKKLFVLKNWENTCELFIKTLCFQDYLTNTSVSEVPICTLESYLATDANSTFGVM